MVSVVDELFGLRAAYIEDGLHEVTATAVASAICHLLEELSLKDEAEDEKLGEWLEEVRQLQCRIVGEHVWILDHCCYWGHKYCENCGVPKYPELNQLSCAKAIETIGRITEEEYNDGA